MTTVEGYRHHDREQLKMRREQYIKKESGTDEGRNKKTNWRHFFIVCSVLISAYLINGEHAQTVCNICTTVPAAIFTYGQLSDHATRIFAYHDAAKSLMEQQQRRNSMVNSIISSNTPVRFPGSPYGSQMGLNTAMTITDATQFSVESPFKSYAALHHNSLTTAYSMARSPEMTAYLDTSYTHDGSLKTVASTEEQFNFGIQKHRQTALSDSSVMPDSGEENDKSENDAVKSIPAGDCQKADTEADGSLHSSEYSTSATVKEEETLITNPSEYIIFKYPFTEMVTIYAKNKHTRPIMWALKTNAIKRMIAQPTCGTLAKDATVHIKIGVTAIPPEESNMIDRLAIDYRLVDDDTISFDRSFLCKTEDPFRRRKKFNIYYEN
ncbi:MSP domain-containing protein [Loa loa]|uniref:Major sperm protein n=1 Tax=Loa loa TaxID=7209 RepID=A0A1S0TUR7_LOALO|nr:MSP domain-containing protein [Loa loa]EFO20516.1 MSP domain-containing protein [Loa loa]